MRSYVVQTEKRMEVKPCICGHYPEFITPDLYYSDTWLKCPNCKRRTHNTGGFHYAHEIPNDEARTGAIWAWNNDKVFVEEDKK